LTFGPKLPAQEYSSPEHAKRCSLYRYFVRKIFSDLLSTVCCRKKLDVDKWKGRTGQNAGRQVAQGTKFHTAVPNNFVSSDGSWVVSPFWPPRIFWSHLGLWNVSMRLFKGNKGIFSGDRLSLIWRCHSISLVGKRKIKKDLAPDL
jgi:hypothetical protein